MSRQSSVASHTSKNNREMVTGANLTSQRVPEFRTVRLMQSREPLQRQEPTNDEFQDTVPSVFETTIQYTPLDPFNGLPDVVYDESSLSTNSDGTPSQHDYADVRWQK